ncbi:PocR ligand-binding domain-containing protein [Paenibacillus tritici]|jgi:ligand-binding sensor protein/AraC-like DNA-binding protein|uniref:PocR ligand-binding domain-containing protein n=1 Tax=Paenibacillus tritici TaxID=1873425 RepID=A0ABX2DRU1_9BACL|nr:PocR ligand-binding domain-containing protein [Paenibacillus tritici]NQX47409.1 PocR ligand-binding domain-containing protein [Paenibacillus tritici]QUL55923.1 PocR ligand-binding domain-containing protein [Paenibacillus tritici]
MRNSLEQFEQVVDTQALQVIQDDLAAVTDMAVLTVDAAGKPVTRHSKCTDFCRAMRSATRSSRLCESCDYRGGHAAQSMQRPYVYKCHMGIVDMAVPLVAGSRYLGSIMLGQISIPGQEAARELDLLGAGGGTGQREYDTMLEEYYRSLPVMSYERIESVAQLVTHMSHYITGRIGAKNRTYGFGSTAAAGAATDATDVKPEQAVQEQKVPRQQVQEAGPPAGRKQAPGTVGGSIRLKPALEYIHEHFRERLTLAGMAKLCWISADYFSRLFRQETGSTFSSYISSLRLEEAKRCLVDGEDSVVSIAYALGFEDCGYFIRTFKKSTGETPAAYRLKRRGEA